MPKPLNIFLTTYNANLRARTATLKDLTAWLTPRLADYSDGKTGEGQGSPPDLVVLGMQEVAELHLALAGATSSAFSLLSLQIRTILSSHASSLGSTTESYTLLGLSHHANVALWVYALDRTLPVSQKVRGEKGMVLGSMIKRTVGLGFAGGLLGNKAAAGGRIWVERGEGDKPLVESFTFVCAHFAPHPGRKNIAIRIENYNRLVSRLIFPLHPPIPRIEPIETQINACSHLFLLGDLNHRFEGLGSLAGAPGPLPEAAELRGFIQDRAAIDGSLVQGNKGQTPWGDLKKWDSLTMLKEQGKTAGGFKEGEIGGFAPTYKFEIGQVGVYSKKRMPAYTDRILYSSASPSEPTVLAYTSVPTLALSDHTPVVLSVLVHPCPSSIKDKALLDVQVAPRVSTQQIRAEALASAVMDRTVGLGWWLLIVLGGGKGELVGGGVATALVLMGWMLYREWIGA